ncbi:U6 snRNA phosphodiesterase 1 [Arctopsyche grandis]|uniref:U6 snRNA phosphodiesterase 1 n=1 Tax=Arctopsyche grandis TaxID=121162 RepID=UPI00406D6B2E
MSALSHICQYGSDSSSDLEAEPSIEAPFVTCKPSTSTSRLPVPALISEKSQTEEHLDDPKKHGGRKRSYPHKRGDWSTFVYLPFIPNKKLLCFINILLKQCSEIAEFNIIEDFHLSVSKTFVLKYHWVTPFASSLKHVASQLRSFHIKFDSLNVYCNEERTRTFVGLKVEDSYVEQLEEVVAKVDKRLFEFNLQSFYKNPSFHVSLIWCLGDKKEELSKVISTYKYLLEQYSFEEISPQTDSFCHLPVNQLRCKSGNKFFMFNIGDTI